MDDVTRLFGLSFCMLAGCYIAGAIPLAFTMSEVSQRVVKIKLHYVLLVVNVLILVTIVDCRVTYVRFNFYRGYFHS